MRPFQFARIAACFLIAIVCKGEAAQPAAYARVKGMVCKPCDLPDAGAPLPRHGAVVKVWGPLSFGGHYTIVDFDRWSITHSFVPWQSPPGQRAAQPRRTVAVIPESERPELMTLANRMWASPTHLPGHDAYDVAWEIWLIDGDSARRDGGRGLPDGDPKAWDDLTKKLLDR